MPRIAVLYLIAQLIAQLACARAALVTDGPSLVQRLDRLYEKLEKLTLPPPTDRTTESLAAKLDRLNSLTPVAEDDLTEEDEELLSTIQLWGSVSPEQLGGMAMELQEMKVEGQDLGSAKLGDLEYADEGWGDEELQDNDLEYAMDGSEDWDEGEDPDATSKPSGSVTPLPITREGPQVFRPVYSDVGDVDPVAATNQRPRLLDDSSLTPRERAALRKAALGNMRTVVRAGRCLTPQPRWLSVRQLAPAHDIVYMPPCVQLHRCAPDAGCCYSEDEVCAPVSGKHVTLPFYLNKADGNFSVARMVFFNHTQCACVPRDTLKRPLDIPFTNRLKETFQRENSKEMQMEWRPPTDEPMLQKEEEETAPPMMRRCTCPGLFIAKLVESGCTCVCDWPDIVKRRGCLSLARGREHFGLRDRVCVANGDCTAPTCDYGAYDRSEGRCPFKRFRRRRYRVENGV